MAWVKVWVPSLDSPEVWQLATELSMEPEGVTGKLLRVLDWFNEHSDGNSVPVVAKQILDTKVKKVGFCNALIKCGWMKEYNGRLSLSVNEKFRWMVIEK